MNKQELQQTLKEEFSGDTNVITHFGSIDILTDNTVIIIESFENIKESYHKILGRILLISSHLINYKKCIHLINAYENETLELFKNVCNNYQIDLRIYYYSPTYFDLKLWVPRLKRYTLSKAFSKKLLNN